MIYDTHPASHCSRLLAHIQHCPSTVLASLLRGWRSSTILIKSIIRTHRTDPPHSHAIRAPSWTLELFRTMTRLYLIFGLLLVLVLWCFPAAGQRVSGKLAGRGRGNKSWHTGRIHPSIQQRTQSAVNYYDNKDGAKIVKASHFEFDYMLGRKITFFCEATGLPRPEVSWFKDGAELYQHRFFQVSFLCNSTTIFGPFSHSPT